MPIAFEEFLTRLAKVRAAIATACTACGRDPASVALLPVTKNQPAEMVAYAARAGFSAVGENRVQEARDKKSACGAALEQSKTTATVASRGLPPPAMRWELIGHLQSNKAKLAIAVFDRVQSADSAKLLDVLDRAAAEAGRVLPVLLQVNAGRDPAKFGCELEDAPALIERALACKALRLEGFMTIAPLSKDPAVARRTFAAMREHRDVWAARFGTAFPELSMGMTGDLAHAIAAGSTMIRVGTALFGERTPPGSPS